MLARAIEPVVALTHKAIAKNKLTINIQNLKFFSLFHAAYRSTAKYGNGGTADAVRHETTTGELLSPHSHLGKAIEMRDKLSLLISSQKLNSEEKDLAKVIRKDLQEALTEQSWDKVLVGRKKL